MQINIAFIANNYLLIALDEVLRNYCKSVLDEVLDEVHRNYCESFGRFYANFSLDCVCAFF